MEKTFAWGGRSYAVRPDVAASAINEIIDRDGYCPPESLVAEARSVDHPLHHLFEWRDTVAAERWRRHEARQLIGAVKVIVSEYERPEIVSPAFVSVGHVKDTENRGAGYRSVEVVMSDEGYASEALADAMSRLVALRNRYRALSELEGVWSAIDHIRATGD